jgi:hypothetical protein
VIATQLRALLVLTCLKISFWVSDGKSRIETLRFLDGAPSSEGAEISSAGAIVGELKVEEKGVRGISPRSLNVRCHTSFS